MSSDSNTNIYDVVDAITSYRFNKISYDELIDTIMRMEDNTNIADEDIPIEVNDINYLSTMAAKFINKEMSLNYILQMVKAYRAYINSDDYNPEDDNKNNVTVNLKIDLGNPDKVLRESAKLAKDGSIDSSVFFLHVQQHRMALEEELTKMGLEIDTSDGKCTFEQLKQMYNTWKDGKLTDSGFFKLLQEYAIPSAKAKESEEIEIIGLPGKSTDTDVPDVEGFGSKNVNIGDQVQVKVGSVNTKTGGTFTENSPFVTGGKMYATISDIDTNAGTVNTTIDGLDAFKVDLEDIDNVIYSPENVEPKTSSSPVMTGDPEIDSKIRTELMMNVIKTSKDLNNKVEGVTIVDLVNAMRALQDFMQSGNSSESSSNNTEWGADYSDNVIYKIGVEYAPYDTKSSAWYTGINSVPNEENYNPEYPSIVEPKGDSIPSEVDGRTLSNTTGDNYGTVIRYSSNEVK